MAVSHDPSSCPLEPAEGPGTFTEHFGKRIEPGPLLNRPDKSLFHSMREDILEPLEKCVLIENRLCRVASFPERATPAHELPDLPRGVGEEVLHELWEIPSGRTDEEVNVVRGKAEGEELDARSPHSPR